MIRHKNVLITSLMLIPISLFLSEKLFYQNDPALRDYVYLVVLKPGPDWIEGKPVSEQNLREHGSYLVDQHADDRLIQAGPFTDDSGGAIIYRAENLAQAEEWVASDPAVISEKLTATEYPWRWVEWDYYLERRNQ